MTKKVYFACSIRGGRADATYYADLVHTIKKHATVLTEIFADTKLTAQGMSSPVTDIWSNDMRWIEQADAVIAEVTNPSLGVGYEIAAAERMGKPILCLYRPSEGRKLSAMIDGCPGATIVEYANPAAVEHAIAEFLTHLRVATPVAA